MINLLTFIPANVFCGDSLFNHDVGSARCDFPGGSASALYQSVRKLLSLPDNFKIWTGHDYPPGGVDGRTESLSVTTVEHQNRENKHLKKGVSEDEFIQWRKERDSTLAEPRLLHQSLQFNIRAGELPQESSAGDRLVHMPLKFQGLKI
jgi:glyoxylase-like metal-dependent hydrolase (beta-lactamase superfamily II)